MAKYYVQSGTLKMVVQADEARKAALWAVHRALQQVVPMYDDLELDARRKHHRALRRGVQVLSDTVTLSECGFDAPQVQFDTFDLVTEWNQLMVALARLEHELCPTTATAV